MKILSIYLPAYHQVKENDEWWGEGFTEWDNVKNATSLYKGHFQPNLPLNENYYDLSNVEDIKRQIQIAKEYKVSGFIFYHYWLDKNKMLLEKPVEIFKNKVKEDFEYAFCWANHNWSTTWHGKESKILMKQEYGDEEEWKAHIEYFVEFFKDDRYIKIDGRPLIYIYNVSEIPRFEEMVEYWNNYLVEIGLNPVYIVEYITTRNKEVSSDKSDAVLEFEPLYTTFFDISILNKAKRFICKKLKILDFQNYDKLWNYNIKRKRTYGDKKIFKSCFCAWDNSPRKGKNSMVVKGATPQKFEKYLRKLVNVERKNSINDYIVINAWNEWGEGAMLEPAQEFGFGYLEAIKNVMLDKG